MGRACCSYKRKAGRSDPKREVGWKQESGKRENVTLLAFEAAINQVHVFTEDRKGEDMDSR